MANNNINVKIAIVQSGGVYLDIENSMLKLAEYVEAASQEDADLVVFGESWLGGYPAWLDHCPEAALWNHEPTKKIFARMHQNSITIPGEETRVLQNLARAHHMAIVTGVNEKVHTGIGNGTIYNSLLIIDAMGNIAIHHRKLSPTFTEKLLYGQGDGFGLKSAETHFGRIGGLICWEHWLPLARQAMHNNGELIHIALWPSVHEMHQTASRHYAFEGRCFVVAAGQIMRVSDFPQELKLPDHLRADPSQLILNGGSCIIAPDGQFLLEPQFGREGVIVYDIAHLEQAIRERMTLDISGHYNRSDVFNFSLNAGRTIWNG